MNTKFKVALLTLLGFSASACCGTKKVAKNEDKKEQDIIINEDNDPRVKLMYGVPFPDGSVVRPVDENGNPLPTSPRNGAKSEGAKFPDGRVAIPVDEDGKERIENHKEQIHDEEPAEMDMVLE